MVTQISTILSWKGLRKRPAVQVMIIHAITFDYQPFILGAALFYFPPRFCVCFSVTFVDFLFKPYSHRDQSRAFCVQFYVASQQQITSRAEYDYLPQYE